MEENENKNKNEARLEKLKKHVRENKKAYIAGAGGVVIGAFGMLLYLVKTGKLGQTTQIADIIAINNVDGDDNKIYQRISKYGYVIGCPGKEIYDETDNMRSYASITRAADAIEVPYDYLRRHLTNPERYPLANGHVFRYMPERDT